MRRRSLMPAALPDESLFGMQTASNQAAAMLDHAYGCIRAASTTSGQAGTYEEYEEALAAIDQAYALLQATGARANKLLEGDEWPGPRDKLEKVAEGAEQQVERLEGILQMIINMAGQGSGAVAGHGGGGSDQRRDEGGVRVEGVAVADDNIADV